MRGGGGEGNREKVIGEGQSGCAVEHMEAKACLSDELIAMYVY